VTEVRNQLRVRTPASGSRDDTDLRGDVLDALMLDGLIPMTVDARARDGLVTLTGTTDWHYQRQEAEFLTASVPGVFGIDNEIMLTSAPGGRHIKNYITSAFRRSALLHAGELSVETLRMAR
jgi:osmotically-inducible protein OsmY